MFNFSFFSVTGWGIGLDYRDIEWFALETNRDHSVVFEIASKYCISDSFVDHDGYSIFSKYYTNIIKGPLRYAYLIFCSFLLHMFKNVDSNMTNIFNWKIGKRKHTYSKEAHTKIKIINILWDKNFLALKHFAFQHNIKFMKIITHPIENTVPLCIKGKEKKKT